MRRLCHVCVLPANGKEYRGTMDLSSPVDNACVEGPSVDVTILLCDECAEEIQGSRRSGVFYQGQIRSIRERSK